MGQSSRNHAESSEVLHGSIEEWIQKEDFDQAESLLFSGIVMFANEANFCFSQAIIEEQKGDRLQAILCCEKAVQLNSRFHQAWAKLGTLYLEIGRSEALRCLKKAIRLEAGVSEYWFLLGQIYQAQHNELAMACAFEQALQLAPNCLEYRQALARAYGSLGEPKRALQILEGYDCSGSMCSSK